MAAATRQVGAWCFLLPGALLLATLLSGCAALPSSGPDRAEVFRNPAIRVAAPGELGTAPLRYALVPLSPAVLDAAAAAEAAPLFAGTAGEVEPGTGRIGVGDILSVTIFESGPGGLFIPQDAGSRPGNFVQIPNQQVDRSGVISIPFGQAVRALGRSPAEVEREIERRLVNRALEPQAVVTVVERRARAISVMGDVANSTRFALDPGGERILGAIARAGGPRFPAYETMVTLQRDGRVERALLSEIALRPEQNIQLRADDVVFLSREPRYFLAIGALGQATGTALATTPSNRRFPFEDTRLSVADAVARAGGLQDDRANPRGVFLFRFEEPETLHRIGLPVESAEPIPTIYTVNVEDPSGFFLAGRFGMRHNDLLYVSNAPAVEIQRLLALLLPFSQSGAGARSIIAP
jgi:polysaccharide export outer membrane protein